MRKACLYGCLMAGLVGHGLTSAQSVTSAGGETCERGQRWLTWNRIQFLSSGLALPPSPQGDQRAVTFCIDGVVLEADGLGLQVVGDTRTFHLQGEVTLTMPAR
jgi:hypothetical protein